VQGNPAEAILEAAELHRVDLITIATHGATGWRHLLFGSVAERVVRLARVPVLTVSAREGGSAEPSPKSEA
jgi:nucleotide-binding universal stress UspA family protein